MEPLEGVAVIMESKRAFSIPFNVPNSAFRVFRCSGCGGVDVSCFSKGGVRHWSGNSVCGVYQDEGPAWPRGVTHD